MAAPGAVTAQNRAILHVDLDAFFVSVELLRHPELRGKPVVVGGRGDPRSRGVVSSASYEAREFGVRSGMPLRRAERLCPEAVFLAVDFGAIRPISERFHALLREVSPAVESWGVDEAFVEVTEAVAAGRAPEEIAVEVQRRVREQLGLSCSVGVAPNKLLAKIASDLAKPGGIRTLTPVLVPERVWPLRPSVLVGIGPKTERRLSAMGIATVGELARAATEALARAFGPRWAAWMRASANGLDESPLVTEWERRSCSSETTFDEDVSDPEVLRARLREMAAEVSARLREEGLRARTVGLKIRYSNFETLQRQRTLEVPTDEAAALETAALANLARVPLDRRVRLVGLRASGLERSATSGDQ